MTRLTYLDPLVTVLVLSYNRPRQLAALLESIAAQTYSNIECIVCDDGSTDPGVLAQLDAIDDGAGYSMWKTLRGPRLMPSEKARFCSAGALYNAGMQFAQGQYLSCIGAAGTYRRDRVEWMVRYLEENPDAYAVWGHVEKILVDEEGREIGREVPAETGPIEHHEGPGFVSRLEQGNFIDGPSVMERLDLRCIRTPFNRNPHHWGSMDWERWKRLAAKGARFDMVPRIGETKRVGPHNLGRMLAEGQSLEDALRVTSRGDAGA